jgi:hypothetical protein
MQNQKGNSPRVALCACSFYRIVGVEGKHFSKSVLKSAAFIG